MTSSISPSKIPRLTAILLAVALLSYAASVAYSLFLNPEVCFWKESAKSKLNWTSHLREKSEAIVGIVGGSSTTFAVDPAHVQKNSGISLVNLGLHAGMGPEFLSGFGLAELKEGDTLVVSIEPPLLCREFDTPALGSQLAMALGRPDMLDWKGSESKGCGVLESLPDLRPGGYHVFTMLGKVLLRMPLYRYHVEDIRPGGFQVTRERRPMPKSSLPKAAPLLSESGKALLTRISEVAKANGIRVAYLLPWAYVPEELAGEARQLNRAFLEQVAKIMPVLPEEQLGVWSDPKCFADTGQHLTEECAKRRSEILAQTIQAWSADAGIPGNGQYAP